ncbi:MAG: radical SAM protein [Myxococcales bacterium]|nr:radical SAM protein [Myxococcales bacterium]
MINVTRLVTGGETESDSLRYGEKRGGEGNGHGHGMGHGMGASPPKSASERHPVVVWNLTRTCNLHCVHCYTDSANRAYPGELSLDECRAVIDDLASFGIPALLLSGGEPLVHPHFWEIAGYARSKGLRLTLSTNGTLIDAECAKRIHETGFSYVGISFDGIGEVNDRFRGKKGAYDEALGGVKNLMAVGQKVGLRLTLTRRNYESLDEIFAMIEREGIQRACFYHLVYAGRGGKMQSDDLSHAETRDAMDKIIDHTRDLIAKGLGTEILTVDNHVDGPYIYMRLVRDEELKRAMGALALMEWNGGGMYSSGVGIGDIDPQGDVHADQFWQTHGFGNVRERPFSEIWMDESDPLMHGLKHRAEVMNETCKRCYFWKSCGGAFRARAALVHGDPWAMDPGCYLTEKERAGIVA